MQREFLQQEILTQYIRNKDIRTLFEQKKWDVWELLTFVHHGYVDIHEKKKTIEKVKELSYLTESERQLVEDVYEVYEHVIEVLYYPKQRSIFHVAYIPRQAEMKRQKASDIIRVESSAYDVFDSIEELYVEIEQYYQPNDGMMEFQVDLFHIPIAGKHTNPISFLKFTAAYAAGKYLIGGDYEPNRYRRNYQ